MLAMKWKDNSEIITHKSTKTQIGRKSLFIDKQVMEDYYQYLKQVLLF